MRQELVTPPTAVLMDAAAAKEYLRIDGNLEDSLLVEFVAAATTAVERMTNLRLLTQTWRVWFDRFPSNPVGGPWWDGTREMAVSELRGGRSYLELPISPLVSVVVTTYNRANEATVFEASKYFVDTSGYRPRVVLNDNQIWPTNLREHNAIKVEFVCGFGATAANVPADLRMAVKQALAFFYENRGDENVEMPDSVKRIVKARRDIKL